MTQKKKFFIFSLILSLIYQQFTLHATDLEDEILSGLFYYDEEDSLPTDLSTDVITRSNSSSTTVSFLQQLGMQNILRNPLYLRTSPIMRMPLLDLPMFQVFVKFEPVQQFELYPFYSQTYSEHFYKNHDTINKYLAFQDPVFLVALDAAEKQFSGPDASIDVPGLISLFHGLKVQERRTGFMGQYIRGFEDWAILVRMPLYYQEHNLYLTPAEQAAINENPFFKQFTGDDYMEFARQHLIADAFGIGDMRINIECFTHESDIYQWGGGLRFTIPTGCAFKKGLFGSSFPNNAPSPYFDFDADFFEIIFSQGVNDQVMQNLANYGESILDRLSTILLNESMGNIHHFGLGVTSHGTMIFSSWISLGSLTQVEILTPGKEDRFFYLNPDTQSYNSFDWSDPTAQVNQKLDYFNDQLQRKFFPPMYRCTVFPGFILQNTTALTFEFPTWTGIIGSDLWFQTPEDISDVDVPLEYAPYLNIQKSSMGGGYQAKIWGSIERNPVKESYWVRNKDETRTHLTKLTSWTIGLRGEAATNSYTVGGDWGFSFYIKNDF